MGPLAGVAVLVTRPEQQASALCSLLESAGATVVRLPVMEIQPVAPPLPVGNGFGSVDLVIFTSANAVKFGAGLLDRRGTPDLVAIGPATARALAQTGLKEITAPAAGFDSEHLLAHPRLANVNGQRVLIMTGRHGRQLLQEQLALRGAQIVVAEVYERVRAIPAPADIAVLERRFADHHIDVITATSADIATYLLELAGPALRRAFDQVHWLVPSERVAAAVRAQGVRGPFLLAASAADQDSLAAVLRWRASESGA